MKSKLAGFDVPDTVYSLPFLAIAGILSGMYEGYFLLESLMFPLIGILLSVFLQKKDMLEIAGKGGFVVLGFLMFSGIFSLPPILFFSAAIAVFIYFLSSDRFRSIVAAVSAQLMDGLSTIIVLGQGGSEKMLVPAYAIDMMGPKGIMVVKVAVLLPYVIYSLSVEDRWLDFFVYAAGIILLFHNIAL